MPAGKKNPTSAVSELCKPFKVFVSSTYLDNKDRRMAVQEVITMAEMVWHEMEIFTAGTRPTVEYCLLYVREADVLVGIIARRYGWIPEGSDISIIEMEYDAANERLMFVLDSSLPYSARACCGAESCSTFWTAWTKWPIWPSANRSHAGPSRPHGIRLLLSYKQSKAIVFSVRTSNYRLTGHFLDIPTQSYPALSFHLYSR